MLPGPLVSIYQHYKQDTNAVASWLASTARACGYPGDLLASGSWERPGPVKSGRLKGKARTQAASQGQTPTTTTPKYIVALKDFLPLAKFIAGKIGGGSISVPDAFGHTLDRLIATRSSFGARLAEHGAKPDLKADSRHGYFVGILEEVRDALRPHMSTEAASATAAAPPSTTDALTNRFAALEVSEPSEEFLIAAPVERPKQAASDKTVYEAESQTSLEEALFAMSAVINDLLKIRAVIEWMWANYRDGIFDLCAAAVATNTAIELARKIIDDVTPVFAPHGGIRGVLSMFFRATCMAKGLKTSVIENAMILENGHTDETYKLADDLCVTAHRLLISFKDIMEPGQVPIIKDGFWGRYDPESYSRGPKTGRQMAEDDKIILAEFFTELMVLIRGVPSYPVQDEFLRSMRELDKTGEVSFSLTFAAQVFLDIHHILRDKASSGAARLFTEIEVMEQELDEHVSFH
jgi:hypothetical protein